MSRHHRPERSRLFYGIRVPRDTSPPRKYPRKPENRQTKKKRHPANRVADSANQAQSSAASNWSTPLDEMKTEELETAVEKAMRQGYNPISNERNK